MYFALICTDNENSLETRKNTRSDHLDYLNSLGNKLKLAGPLLDSDDNPNGSLIVIEVENQNEANEIAKNDPYAKVNLFKSVEIRQWNWLIKN